MGGLDAPVEGFGTAGATTDGLLVGTALCTAFVSATAAESGCGADTFGLGALHVFAAELPAAGAGVSAGFTAEATGAATDGEGAEEEVCPLCRSAGWRHTEQVPGLKACSVYSAQTAAALTSDAFSRFVTIVDASNGTS